MKFTKKSKTSASIPQASLEDIVFMLLIFFMVSTVMKTSEGLQVNLPDAEKIKKLEEKRGVATIWADDAGRISIDDHLVEVKEIRNIIYNKVSDDLNPMKLVSLRADKNVEMGQITEIHEELRTVGGTALNINYSTLVEAE